MPNRKKMPKKPTASSVDAGMAAKPADPFRPWLLAGMTAALVARPLFPSESAATDGDGLPVVMFWLALLVIWLLAAISHKRFSLRFGSVDAAVLLLVAWQCIAAAHAVRHGSPRPALNMLWEWIGLGIVFFLARQLIHDAREVRAVVAAMIALMAAISVYGIYQYAIELPTMQRQYNANPEAMMREAGLNYPSGAPLRDLLEKRLANREPLATFALTNSLAAALSPWLVVGLGIVVATRHDRRQWIFWLICIFPIALCLLLTKSRSGYAAVAVGVIWLAAVCWRFRLRWLAGAVALMGLLVAAAMIAGHSTPTLARAATSLGYRLQYWQATAHLIADRPLLGCGPGNFQDVYTQYKLPEASEEVADPHNFLFEVWATAGTPALLALLGIFVLFVKSARNDVPPTDATEQVESVRPQTVASPKLPAPRNDWKFVLIGLIGGFLLSIPVGQISAAPPNIIAILIGLPVAVVWMVFLIPWVRNGTFPPALAGLGVAVLLVDLLTTGGIGMPAVAQSLWLLLALGLNRVWPRDVSRAVAVVLLAIGLGLLVVCHQTSYARVLPCASFQRLARREYLDGHRQSAQELLQRAVDADPRSSDAHAFLSELYLEAWLANLQSNDYDAFESHDALARQTAPEAAPIWRASADRFRRAFAKTDAWGRPLRPRAIQQAIEIARRTVELYPGSGIDRADLALDCQLAGDEVSYHREVQAALQLDRRMPHEDKKLPEALRRKLEAAGAK